MGDRSVKIGGSNIGGVISTGENANIRVHNENIGNLPGEQSEKEKLAALLEELNGLLKEAPAEKKDDAEAVADFANDLIEQAGAEKPNKRKLEITAKGMTEAAEGIASVVPKAITVVEAIAGMVMRMM